MMLQNTEKHRNEWEDWYKIGKASGKYEGIQKIC